MSAVLAQLLAQGRQEGADLATLRAIAEEAGEQAATRALAIPKAGRSRRRMRPGRN